jgi:hypothetical protein
LRDDGLRGRWCDQLCHRNRWRCGRAAGPLLGQGREILLPAIKGVDLLTSRTLEVHSEQYRPDE